MDKLQWVFELIEKVSGPAKKATESTIGFENELKKVHAQIEKIKSNPVEFKKLQNAKKELRELSGGSQSFAKRFEEMGQSIKRVGFVQNLMLGAEAFKLMFEAGEKVFDLALDIGRELIGAAGHAERMGIAFKTLAGNEGGEQALEYIEKIKKYSELSGAQLQNMSAELLTAGFNAKELGQALPAALDIAGFTGGGIEKVQEAVQAMTRIRQSGKVENRSLRHLGLGENSEQNLLKALAKAKGESVEQIKHAMEAGKLDPQEVLYQVYQLIIKRQHGNLGTTAQKMTETVTGKLEKLKQLPEEIFEKWAKSPGFAKFSTALGKILEKLDPDGPNGQKIFKSLDTMSGKVVTLIDKFASGDGVDKFVAGVEKGANFLTNDLGPALDKIVTVSEVLATIWAGSKIVGGFASMASAANPFSIIAASLGLAYAWINKIANDLGGWLRVAKDFKDWMHGDQPAVARGNSGYEKLQEENKKNLELARQRAAIPSSSLGDKPGKGSVSQNATIQAGAIVINAPSGKADEIADHVNKTLPGAMQQGFERMAVSAGAM